MAGLPPDGEWVMQQNDGRVSLSNRYTGEEIVNFDPGDPESFGPALMDIRFTTKLTDEQTSFASFWVGYFYAHTGKELHR